MVVLFDGLRVLSTQWAALSIFLLGPLGYGVWMARPFTRGQERSQLLSLALAIPLGWIAVAVLVTFISVLGHTRSLTLTAAWIVLGISCALLAAWLVKIARRVQRRASSSLFGFAAALALGLLVLALRLEFVKNLLLPPYSDSLFHVQLSESFFTGHGLAAMLQARGLYHFGFHALTAWISALTGIETLKLMPILGQICVALFSMGVFATLLAWKNRLPEALLGALLAGFAWNFPAFAANWGKYPTLAAVVLLPVLTTFGMLTFRARKKTWLFGLLLLYGFGSLLFHTRLIVVMGLAVFAFSTTSLTWKIQRPGIQRVFQAGLLAAALGLLFLDQEIAFSYVHDPFMMLILLAITVPFLAVKPSFIVRVAALFTIGLLLLTRKSMPFALPGGTSALVDLPFALAILPFPLAVWWMSGIEDATALISRVSLEQRRTTQSILLAMLIFSLFRADFRPDPCCDWARPADLAAFNWINQNLPTEARIYVPGVEDQGRLTGVDAGLWINRLTHREIVVMPLDTRWFDPGFQAQVCQQSPGYIYDSGLDQSFQLDGTSYPKWYKAVYTSDTVVLYSILPCPISNLY